MPEEDKVNLDLLELNKTEVNLVDILLDPNNPRLLEMGYEEVPDNRIAEEEVQNEALSNMKKIGLKDIIEKVRKVGFLNVDRVVVRPLNGGKYIVVEGNRRISSLKVLNEDHGKGRINLNNRILESINKFEVLIYEGGDKDIAWFIQGLRHIRGIKDWGALQQGKFLIDMKERKSLKPTDLDAMTGLGRTTISNLIRSYKAWEQAKEDEDYGDKINPENFSIFNEAIFKKPIFKTWLEWDDNSYRFKNLENFKKILSWYLGDENINDGEPRLPRVNPDIRDILSRLLAEENKPLLEQFENGDITIEQARHQMDEDKFKRGAQESKIDLNSQLAYLNQITTTLQTLPIPKIIEDKEKTDVFIERLENVENAAMEQRKIISTMKSQGG